MTSLKIWCHKSLSTQMRPTIKESPVTFLQKRSLALFGDQNQMKASVNQWEGVDRHYLLSYFLSPIGAQKMLETDFGSYKSQTRGTVLMCAVSSKLRLSSSFDPISFFFRWKLFFSNKRIRTLPALPRLTSRLAPFHELSSKSKFLGEPWRLVTLLSVNATGETLVLNKYSPPPS